MIPSHKRPASSPTNGHSKRSRFDDTHQAHESNDKHVNGKIHDSNSASKIDEDVIRKRKEKLKLWQEKKKKMDMKKISNSESDSFGITLGFSNLRKKKKENDDMNEDEVEEALHKAERHSKLQKVNLNVEVGVKDDKVTENKDDIDPLEAYMKGIEEVTPSRLDLDNKTQSSDVKEVESVQTITLDEILSTENNDSQSTLTQPSDFKTAFLEEMRKLREKEDEAAEKSQNNLQKELEEQFKAIKDSGKELSKGDAEGTGLGLIVAEDGDHDEALMDAGIGPSALELLQEKIKKKDLKAVDHSKIDYPQFRKKFYVEASSVMNLTDDKVSQIRKELEIEVRGNKVPKPISSWSEAGLSERTLNVLRKRDWEKPFAIQRQALPAIMSGRDLIGVAKTGSGKTLAFLLPMIRHVLDQPRVGADEGPIGLILAPARELAMQIHLEAKKFSKALNIRSACCYGGAGIKEQIGSLKSGAEIVVATPGRLIDLLCANKLLSLRRVTMVVLDEADRMFDMGFEPQVMKIINNTRPDRQIAMFSATFPPQVERVAKELLRYRPLIIVVGGRTKASANIIQHVEIREGSDKFPRLLQLLGDWYMKGNILVFVKSQDRCDKLFQDLLKVGYRALSLHGGKDQFDRDSTIQDFKEKRETLMVATSVAGRGLDVPDLCLVVNFDVPNHLEDYIHRIGRTGRAGKEGTAYTFLSKDEDMYAPDLVKALSDAKQPIPPELEKMSIEFREKIARGEAKFRNSGYRGHGFTFDENEKTEISKQQDLLRKKEEVELGLRDDEMANEDETKIPDLPSEDMPAPTPKLISTETSVNYEASSKESMSKDEIIQRARRLALAMGDVRTKTTATGAPVAAFCRQVEINQYPQQARWKVTNRDTIQRIQDETTASIIGKGVYIPPGRTPNPGELPLFLQVEGNSEYAVSRAVNEISRILDAAVLELGAKGTNVKSSKYLVL